MAGRDFDALLRRLASAPAIAPPGAFRGTPRFELLRRLGVGGFGEVYEARDRDTGDRVALKVLRHLHPEWLYRFKREYRTLQGITHPGLVRLHDLVSWEGHWFFTMELVEGVDFLRFAAGSPDRVRGGARDLAGALAALHRAGKVHRDVKPSNVLVEPAGRVVVLDFGLVGEVDERASLAVVGTPAYMAPEQAAGAPATGAADWYSVGVMLLEALAGAAPVSASAIERLRAPTGPAPPDLRALAPGAPADLLELCAALLRPEPAARPSDEEILALLSPAPPADAALPGAPEELFVGRDDELAALRRALADTARGAPVVVLVSGESGIGKTTLLHRFTGGVATADSAAIVLEGRCYERESVPYKALDGVVDELSRCLARLSPVEVEGLLPRDAPALTVLFPVLRRVEAFARPPRRGAEPADRETLRRLGTRALAELLARLADRRLVVVCIDDLQWGDADSAAMLAQVLRGQQAPALLVVGAARATDRADSPFFRSWTQALTSIPSGLDVRAVALAPLDAEASRDLAGRLLDRRGGDRSRATLIGAEAAGNPFLIGALVDHGAALPGGPSLRAAVAARAQDLPGPERALVEVVAVSDQPIAVSVAAAAAGLAEGANEALRALRDRRLVRWVDGDEGTQVLCYHDRLRQGVIALLGAEALRRVHRRIAEALELEREPDGERIAVHLEGAGELPRAARFTAAAADRAAGALAFDHASRLYARALALEERSGAPAQRRRALQLKLAETLSLAGRPVESADAFLRLASDADGLDVIRFRCRAGEELVQSGHLDRGQEVLGSALRALGIAAPLNPPIALSRHLANRARLRLGGRARRAGARPASEEQRLRLDTLWAVSMGLVTIAPVPSAALRSQHALLAREVGDPSHLIRAELSEALGDATLRDDGKRRRCRAALDRAREEARRLGSPEVQRTVRLIEGIVAFLEGRWSAAHELFGECRRELEQAGGASAFERTMADTLACNCLLWRCCPGDLGREAQALRPRYLERGHPLAFLWLSTYAGWAEIVSGREREGLRAAEGALSQWSKSGFYLQHWWEAIVALHVALHDGDGERAWSAVERVWPRLRTALILSGEYHRVEAYWFRARAALAAAAPPRGDARLVRIARGLVAKLEAERTPLGHALAAGIEADLAACDRAGVPALARGLERAESLLSAAEIEGAAVSARWLRGRLLGGAQGAALVSACEGWFEAQEVAAPRRFASVYFPAIVAARPGAFA